MLLDELLIKIGVNADDQTLAAFGQALEALGQNSTEFAERFGQLITEMDALEQAAGEMSDVELFEAWQEKAEAFNALMQDYAKVFDEVSDAVGDNTGALAEQAKQTEQNTQATEEHQQALDDSKKSLVGFILSSVGLDGVADKLKKVASESKSLPRTLAAVATGIGAVVSGLTFFVSKSLDSLDAIHQLSNVTGEATDYIYQLGKVAQTSGSSVEAAEASIMGLSKAIGEAASGKGRGAQAFELYGLKAKNANGEIKQTSEVLEDVREKMKSLSEQEQIAMLAKLGIDSSMIQVLRKDAADFQKEMAENKAMTLGIGTAEDAKTAATFKDALADFFKMMKAVAEVVSLRLAPAITNLLGKFKDWFVLNNLFIRNGLEFFVGLLAGAVDFIAEFIGAVDNIITHTVGWENAFYAIGAVIVWLTRGPLLAFTTALMTNPFIQIIAGIVALIALIDDFITYLEGGESFFGEYWEPLAEGVREVQKWLKKFSPELEWLQAIFSRFLNALKAGWSVAFNGIMQVAKGVFAVLGNVIKFFISLFTGDTEKMSEAISGIWQGLKEIVTGIWDTLFGGLKAIWDAFVGDGLDLNVIEEGFKKVTDWIKKPFQVAFDWVKALYDSTIGPIIDAVSNFSPGEMLDSAGDAIKDGWDSAKETVGGWFGSIGNFFSGENNPIQTASSAPLVAKAGVANSTMHNADNSVKNSNNKVTVTQHIQNMQNPQEVANLAGRAVMNALGTTVQ